MSEVYMVSESASQDSLGVVEKWRKLCLKVLPEPPQIKYLIANVLFQCWSTFGSEAIFIKFLQEVLLYDADDAASISLLINSFSGLVMLISGYISDSYLGKYYTIAGFSVVNCCGLVLMAIAARESSRIITLIGFALMVIGAGGTNPCMTAFGGDQFSDHSNVAQDRDIERFFMVYYLAQNFAAISGSFIFPLIRLHYGYFWGFFVAAICNFLALTVFLRGTRKYVRVPPGGSVLKVILRVCCSAKKSTPLLLESRKQVKENKEAKDILTFYDENIAEIDFEQGTKESWSESSEICTETKSLVRKPKKRSRTKEKYSITGNEVYELWELVPIFLCFVCFWALYNQQISTWEQQAEEMDT